MAQAMPRIHNLVHDFLTAPADRKCLHGPEKANRLQLSAYFILRIFSPQSLVYSLHTVLLTVPAPLQIVEAQTLFWFF